MLSRLFSSKSKKTSVTVGVSVCASELHIVAIERSGDAVSLNSVSSIPYDQHQPLKQQLSAALSPFAKSTCNVSIVLSQHMYHMVQVDKPEMAEEDITTALPWTLGELVPYGSGNMVLDYVYPVKSRSGGQKINVFAAERSSLLLPQRAWQERQAAYTYPHQTGLAIILLVMPDTWLLWDWDGDGEADNLQTQRHVWCVSRKRQYHLQARATNN